MQLLFQHSLGEKGGKFVFLDVHFDIEEAYGQDLKCPNNFVQGCSSQTRCSMVFCLFFFFTFLCNI